MNPSDVKTSPAHNPDADIESLSQAKVETEARLQAMLDNFPYLAWLKDTEGRFVAVNMPFVVACGRERTEDVLGLTDLDIWPRELATQYRADDSVVMRSGDQKLVEELIAHEGVARWFETFKAPIFDGAGRLIGTTGFSRDITERRRARDQRDDQEQRLQALIDSAPFGAHQYELRAGGDLVFVGANRSADRILGLDNGQFIGKPIEEAFPALVATGLPGVYRRIAAEGGVFDDEQVSYSSDVLRGAFEIHAVQTGPGRMAVFFRDITEVRKLEDEQKRLEAQVQQAQKMEAVGQLAGGVAHDFNNLLSVIISYAGFALDDLPQGSPVRADILEVKRAGERAAGLTRQLLAFSRKQIIEPRELGVNDAVHNLAKMLKRLIGENIALDLKLAPDAGVIVVDPTQFDQAMTNLAVNARDAMPGGGRLIIETANASLDGDYARLHADAVAGEYVAVTVSDTGTGIPRDILTKVFEPFFTTKPQGKGTGLGLSMVYGAMKQNGGHVSVYSEVGIGTTFKLYFKRSVSDDGDRGDTDVDETPAGDGRTILVVEDDDAVRGALVRLLRAGGYAVIDAANGADALAMYKSHAPVVALVISDVVMPGMSGAVLGDELRRLDPRVKVLYCSGYTDEMLDTQGVLKPGTQLISKPVDRVILLRKVREMLDTTAERVMR